MIRRKRGLSKARKRLQRLKTVEILDWCDQAGSGMFRTLDDYRRLGTQESLLEAKIGLEALLDAVEELLERDG